MTDSKGAAIEKILKDYRSQVANITQQYWDDAGTGVDTGVTTELLNQIDEEARQAILAILAQEVNKARIDELKRCLHWEGHEPFIRTRLSKLLNQSEGKG